MPTFSEIMQQITAGLTGDTEHDAAWLREQCGKYRDHEMAREILRACGRLLAAMMPEEDLQEIHRILRNALQGYESILEEVQFKAHQGKFPEAIALLEPLIREIEEGGLYEDDQVSEYHCFDEFFEEVLYREWEKPARDLRRCDFPYAFIYFQYGSLLFEMKRFEDARSALEAALKWNPASAMIGFEHAETYKMLRQLEEFRARTLELFRYAFRPEQVARCFRNLGYYYVEKRQWEAAVTCYERSLIFEPDSQAAMSELFYIREESGTDLLHLYGEELEACARRCLFPTGPDPDVIGLAYGWAKYFLEEPNIGGARYCLGIVYGLTQDEQIRALMEKLPEEEDAR